MSYPITTIDAQARLELERTIIGPVLLENCYSKVGRYINTKNFSNRDYQTIWQAISEMWPSKPIDLRTVSHHLRRKQGKNFTSIMVECTLSVNSASNIEYHALCLLECDIQDKVLQVIERHNFDPLDSEIKIASEEIWTEMRTSSDILRTLEAAAEYLLGIDPEHSISKEVFAYHQAIAAKAKEIKANYPVRRLVSELEALGRQGDLMRQIAIKKTGDILITLLNSQSVTPETVEQLSIISTHLKPAA